MCVRGVGECHPIPNHATAFLSWKMNLWFEGGFEWQYKKKKKKKQQSNRLCRDDKANMEDQRDWHHLLWLLSVLHTTKRGDVILELRWRCSYHINSSNNKAKVDILKPGLLTVKLQVALMQSLHFCSLQTGWNKVLLFLGECFCPNPQICTIIFSPIPHYIVSSVYEPCYYCKSNCLLNSLCATIDLR